MKWKQSINQSILWFRVLNGVVMVTPHGKSYVRIYSLTYHPV